jgi:hypothetical protein
VKPWKAEWFRRVRQRRAELWRGVEAQHFVATMRLVDTLAEQRLLEEMLEASKPAPPAHAAGRHPLIATPFRYVVPFDSRCRRADEAGIWYGAESVRTCCAEIAYWRWRFVVDSTGLHAATVHTQHTLFPAQVRGRAVDLDAPPWNALAAQWTATRDYTACQALAAAAREQHVEWIRYCSVRDPRGHCGAILTATALGEPDLARQQTWHCRTTPARISLVRAFEEGFEFEAAAWA